MLSTEVLGFPAQEEYAESPAGDSVAKHLKIFMKKIYFILFVLFVVACKNEDPAPTVTELLTGPSNGWEQTSVLVTIPGTSLKVDVFNDPAFEDELPACHKDNLTVLMADGTYYIAGSTVKCTTDEPTFLEAGSWTLSSDEKVVTFTPLPGAVYTATILEISADELKVDATRTIGSTVVSATITLKPKIY
jgi:hypothetical protein